MQQLWKKILISLFILLILPIGITAGISGRETMFGNLEVDLETFLPILMCQQVDWNYEEETLKAQAVLARSSLSLCIQNGEWVGVEWKNLMSDYRNQVEKESYKRAYEKMKQVVKETSGEVLMYENRICQGVFHKVSAGFTRNGTETLQDVSYEYLTIVKSENDILAKNYLHGHYFSKEALIFRLKSCYPDIILEENIFQQLQIIKRDESDYVTRMCIGNLIVSGEEFRIKMGLASANFTIQELDGKIRFLCKGMGHGLGMSQFGANEMAKNGDTYLNILAYYFPQAKVKKM